MFWQVGVGNQKVTFYLRMIDFCQTLWFPLSGWAHLKPPRCFVTCSSWCSGETPPKVGGTLVEAMRSMALLPIQNSFRGGPIQDPVLTT